ncbi:cyclic pyranopterin monophosphate synthase MoaC [bacterium]|nr:cyclic pyranopterin monophosphate synthase MoaC [bacterium]
MGELSHTGPGGEARMVDVGDKPATQRQALAEARLSLGPAAWSALVENRAAKGDVLAVARIAGIAAAKRTAELIPLCHPLGLDTVAVDFSLEAETRVLVIRARARCRGRTGVEMEALTAASVAALTAYDMLKAVEKGIVIGPIRLLEKSGGASGDWRAA